MPISAFRQLSVKFHIGASVLIATQMVYQDTMYMLMYNKSATSPFFILTDASHLICKFTNVYV